MLLLYLCHRDLKGMIVTLRDKASTCESHLILCKPIFHRFVHVIFPLDSPKVLHLHVGPKIDGIDPTYYILFGRNF